MKLFNTSRRYIYYLSIVVLFISCHTDNTQEKLLTEAQNRLVGDKPENVLNLLSSIDNPEKMNKENYMQYIVISVGVKKESGANIKSETLIFEAQEYFNKKRNSENSALANYYAGWVYYSNNQLPKALESFMYTADAADKLKNHLLAGKSFNNIGYIYFERSLLDSAITNYRKALFYYGQVENIDKKKIKVLTNIGRAYEGNNSLDSAYLYFQKGLNLAKQTDNKLEERRLYHNLGVTSYNKGEYDKAIEYFQSALEMEGTDEDQKNRAYLSLLKIYNLKHDTNSAKKYANSIEEILPEVTYKYTVKEMYASLSEYYQQLGDYKQALYFSDLEKLTQDQIEKEKNIPALMEATNNFNLAQKEREAEEFREIVLWYLAGGVFAFLFLLLLFIYDRRDTKRFKQEIERRTEKYDLVLAWLRAENEKYPKIEAEIKAMMEDTDKGKEEGEK